MSLYDLRKKIQKRMKELSVKELEAKKLGEDLAEAEYQVRWEECEKFEQELREFELELISRVSQLVKEISYDSRDVIDWEKKIEYDTLRGVLGENS